MAVCDAWSLKPGRGNLRRVEIYYIQATHFMDCYFSVLLVMVLLLLYHAILFYDTPVSVSQLIADHM